MAFACRLVPRVANPGGTFCLPDRHHRPPQQRTPARLWPHRGQRTPTVCVAAISDLERGPSDKEDSQGVGRDSRGPRRRLLDVAAAGGLRPRGGGAPPASRSWNVDGKGTGKGREQHRPLAEPASRAIKGAASASELAAVVRAMERGSGGLSDGDLVRALLRLSELSEPPPKGKEEGDERDGGRDGEGALLAVELSALAAERVARGRICSPSALAAVLSCLGNLRVDGNADAQSGRQIGQVLGDALLRLATFGNLPTGIVINGLVSLARMGHYHKQMCAEVETQLADGAIDAFTSQQLANISWAFASMGHQTGDTFDRIAESLLSRWEEGKGGEANSLTLSKLAHSFCKAQHPVPALLDYVAGQVVERTQEFQLKQLALIAWAFAKASRPVPLAYDAIYRRLEEGIDSLATSSLSISLWALGATHHPCTSFLAASEAAVVSNLSYFTTQGLADVASSYARLGYSCPELMERLAEVSAARIVQFNDRELANLMWAFAVAGYKAPKLFAAGQSAAAARAAEMHVQDLTTITWASVKTGSQSLPCFAAMAVHLETRAGEMTPRDIANAAWSFAIAGIRDAELFSALEEASLNQVDAFCPQSASSTLYSFAKASRKAPRLFSKMERRVKEQLEASTPQGIANSLWAYARNGHKAPGLFSAVTAHILKERPGGAGAFNAQEISNIAWACAKLRFEAPGLLEALADRAADLAGSLTPQGISNTMWALAKGGMREQGAAVKLAAEARSRVGDFTELELSNVLWAAGQLLRWGGNQECSNVMEELFAAAEEHIIRDLRRDDFNTVALTIAIQAYARAGQPATRLCDAVEQAVSLGAARFPPRDLSSIAWSFGKLNERAPMMFRAIARNARGCPLAWEPRHLATVMWGCGRLRYSLPGLLLVIEDALVNRRDQFSTQALSNLAQACAQLGIRSEVVLKSVEEEVMGREDGSFRKKELESIAWAYRKLGAGDEKFFEHICQQQKIRRWHHRESREGAGGS